MHEQFTAEQTAEKHLIITVSDVAPDTILCALTGEIDLATGPELQKKLSETIRLAPAHLVIDMSDVEFLGSAGLEILVEVHATRKIAGDQLALVVGHNTVVTRPLSVTGLDHIFDLHTELATAIKACRPPTGMPG